MFIIEERDCICRTVLLIVLLEFTSADQSSSDQRTCENSNTRSISYFKVNNEKLNWNDALSLCKSENSLLPAICNQHEQDALTNYLKASWSRDSPDVWTSGSKTQFNEWIWIDGQPFSPRVVIPVRPETHTHGALDENRRYRAENPIHKVYYLCQYSDSSITCNSENAINVTKGCIKPSDEDRSWYDARNQCLLNAGDLAILNDDDLAIVRRSNKLNAGYSYWIGLRKNAWRWMRQRTANSRDEIEYTNWPRYAYSLSDDCISINAPNGEWKASRCAEKKQVVCEGNPDDPTSSTTIRTLPRTISNKKASTMSSVPSRPTSSMWENMTQAMTEGHSDANCQVLIFTSETGSCFKPSRQRCKFDYRALEVCSTCCLTGVGLLLFAVIAVVIGALCVIIISNIIVALVVRKCIYQRANASSISATTETKLYQDLEMTQRQANPDCPYTELQLQPVYDEVTQRGK